LYGLVAELGIDIIAGFMTLANPTCTAPHTTTSSQPSALQVAATDGLRVWWTEAMVPAFKMLEVHVQPPQGDDYMNAVTATIRQHYKEDGTLVRHDAEGDII
jgi:hypothetical protein